ncbi:MAG: hypothetical protein LBI04_04250 [Treponema sp.]|jgi:hypothetical protein|nr:hypothetical protein [Treponema sp.]
MTAVKAYYNGKTFVPQNPVSAEINQEAIVTFLEPQPLGAFKKERLLSLAGSISHNDYLEMEKALEETEKVYSNEW